MRFPNRNSYKVILSKVRRIIIIINIPERQTTKSRETGQIHLKGQAVVIL